ncbi:tyrosine-type recombinase/integrase [Candidatus Puniceispirillum sp.]|nr:tyrosine-type recombinase/integrase [Alphaproteobacteria bacterium]MDC1294081.1 tyrosine-type recombinase/integrase [Candidatus Puniceispirillum sp.]
MRNKCEANHVLYRDGVYYYVRRVPYDLTSYYDVKRLCFSLKTKSLKAAIRTSKSVTQRLEDYWLGLRLQNMDIPAIQVVRASDEANDATLRLSEACELYLRLKGVGKDKVFIRTANRNTGYVTKLLGDKPISSYSSNEAAQFRDWCIDRGMGIKTVKRVFSSIRAIVNLAIAEEGLDCSNAFAKTFFPNDDNAQSRQPISLEDIKKVQSLCKDIDDEMRWLIALISDTGMRLGEAAGLLKEELKLNEPIPYIELKPHPWRTLKTKGSQRLIPLTKEALWASKRLLEANNDSIFAFPRYCDETGCKANSASGGLNKWLHQYVPENCVIHSFRHSLRDRLRAVECPSDIVDAIGGWKTSGVGHGYGNGYPLEVLEKWMDKL